VHLKVGHKIRAATETNRKFWCITYLFRRLKFGDTLHRHVTQISGSTSVWFALHKNCAIEVSVSSACEAEVCVEGFGCWRLRLKLAL
jgi:hypothetical protein